MKKWLNARKHKKTIVLGIFLFLYVLSFALSFSMASMAGENPKYLLGAFEFMNYDRQSAQFMENYAGRVQCFLKESAGSEVLKSEEGEALLKNQTKLLSFLAIDGGLSSCFNRPDIASTHSGRILEAASEVSPEEVECRVPLEAYPTPGDFFKSLENIRQDLTWRDLNRSLLEVAIRNVVTNYVVFTLRFDYKGETINLETLITSICLDKKSGKNLCDQAMIDTITSTISKALSREGSQHTMTIMEIKNDLNSRINELNSALKVAQDQISLKEGSYLPFGMWKTSSPEWTEKANLSYQIYLKQYLLSLSSGSGPLLLVDPIKSDVGTMRLKDDDVKLTKNGPLQEFAYNLHGLTDTSHIVSAISAGKKQILEEARHLLKMHDKHVMKGAVDIQWEKKQTAHYIEFHPVAVGKYLLSHPEFTPLVGEVLEDLGNEDVNTRYRNKIIKYSTVALGGALFLTSVGTAVGTLIVPALATSSAVMTIGTVATITGLVMKAGEVGRLTNNYYKNQLEQLKLERSFLAGGGDAHSVGEARRALKAFHTTKFEMASFLGFTAFDMIGMAHLIDPSIQFGVHTYTTASSFMGLARFNDTILPLLKNEKFIMTLSQMKDVMGGPMVAKFLVHLSQVPQEGQVSFMESLGLWDGHKESWEAGLKTALEQLAANHPELKVEESQLAKSLFAEGITKDPELNLPALGQ